MEAKRQTMGAWLAVGVAFVAMLVVPGLVASASASPTPAGSSNSQQWAYGAQKWVNESLVTTNGTYSAQAYFGWQVVYTATNTSNTTVMLEAQRTMKGSFSAQLCAPNCTNPSLAQGNLAISGWEIDTGFLNLTSAASVTVNGSAVAAVGIQNAHSEVQGNLTEALSYSFVAGSHTWSAAQSLDVSGNADAQIAFTPSLGLVPLGVAAGEQWNSSAGFNASGSWALDATWARTTLLGNHLSGNPSASASVQATGSVSLWGSDIGNVTLANGQTVPVVVLVWTGPFDELDGAILVPHAYNLFGSADQSYASEELGVESVSTANLDLYVDVHHHLHVVASATSFASTDDTLATQTTATAQPRPAGTSGASPAVVQGQPETVPQAQANARCLVGTCAGSGASSPGLGGLGLALLVGLVAVVIVGSVSVIEYRVWARNRARMGTAPTTSPIRAAAPPPGAYGSAPPAAPPASGEMPRSPPGAQ